MPKYDFRCEKCGLEFSDMLPMGTIVVPMCETCKNNRSVRKIIRAPMVHFKGSGFYKTDSSRSTVSPSKESKETKATKDSNDVKPAESKPIDPKPAPKKTDTSPKAS
jgi:putative FmdB family regulatory protein